MRDLDKKWMILTVVIWIVLLPVIYIIDKDTFAYGVYRSVILVLSLIVGMIISETISRLMRKKRRD